MSDSDVADDKPEHKVDLGNFLTGLTKLSLQTGIAITGSPELFVMERDERMFVYRADDESRLFLS